MSIKLLIEKLDLRPLPDEGGFYKKTSISNKFISSKYLGENNKYSAVYYLITGGSFSALHTVDQGERAGFDSLLQSVVVKFTVPLQMESLLLCISCDRIMSPSRES